MALNLVYILTPSKLKEITAVHGNVDESLIEPEIIACQDLYIKRHLGSALFNKIISDIDAGTLAGAYQTLVDTYLTKCLANYVLSELPDGIDMQFWNSGVKTTSADNAQNPDMTKMYKFIAKYKKRAEMYAKEARLYILANLSSFPEFHASGGVDSIAPDGTNYTCPIYLRGHHQTTYIRPQDNPGYNSNDPYYLD